MYKKVISSIKKVYRMIPLEEASQGKINQLRNIIGDTSFSNYQPWIYIFYQQLLIKHQQNTYWILPINSNN